MKPLSIVASIITLFAVTASAAPRPVPHTLDRLTRPDLADGSKKTSKVSSRLRAEGRVGPTTGPLVPAKLPRSPEGKLQVYVDCSPLGVEQ